MLFFLVFCYGISLVKAILVLFGLSFIFLISFQPTCNGHTSVSVVEAPSNGEALHKSNIIRRKHGFASGDVLLEQRPEIELKHREEEDL